MHRESSIETIHKRSDALIQELNDIEKECNAIYVSQMQQLTFNTQEIVDFKEFVRKPTINLQEINQILAKATSTISDIQRRIDSFKSELTMNRSIIFEPHDRITSFGDFNDSSFQVRVFFSN